MKVDGAYQLLEEMLTNNHWPNKRNQCRRVAASMFEINKLMALSAEVSTLSN
jgi:hypothetical protein